MTSSHIDIMYNTCYGGFSLSQAAIDEYKRRCPDGKNPRMYQMDRDDQVMVQIIKEMGRKANGQFSDIRLQSIPVEYREHYKIEEYDGLESVVIDHNAFQVAAIKSLVRDRTLSKADKLARITAVVTQMEPELTYE
jgi:hypothetical protein